MCLLFAVGRMLSEEKEKRSLHEASFFGLLAQEQMPKKNPGDRDSAELQNELGALVINSSLLTLTGIYNMWYNMVQLTLPAMAEG